MSQDTRLAFTHPIERARATAGDAPLDRISLRDHIVTVEIGAFQAERDMTQRISFNVVVEVRHEADVLDDDVDRILSYDRVTEAIDIELAAERLNLLETLAERVALRILGEPQAQRVFVRIEKLDRGAGALGVEIVRSAGDHPETGRDGALAAAPPLQPRVVFVSNDALGSPHLVSWVDQLAAMGAPVILCVCAGADTAPRTDHAPSQKRIDLLEIAQNAWVLAARDTRCAVVETRTELDWAIKNGQICVWAPFKMVLDTPDAPLDQTGDGWALALWLAGQMAASEVLLLGKDVPPDPPQGLPIRSHPVTIRDL